MIVPSSRLLFYTALIALPGSAIAAVAPEHGGTALGLVGLFALSTLADALAGFRRRGSVQAKPVESPVRMNRGEPAQIGLALTRLASTKPSLKAGIALPESFRCDDDIIAIDLPEPDRPYLVQWACQPTRRGRFTLDACHLEVPSPLGLWQVRWSQPISAELRVYPSIRSERRKVAALFLTRNDHGIHANPAIGKGREFEQLREYLPGDPYEDIHWGATARRGAPITKVYQVERTQEVYVVIDTSRLSSRPSAQPDDDAHAPTPSMLERYLASALILGVAAEQQGDLFGLATFDKRVNAFLRASRGTTHFNACRDLLYTQHASDESPDFTEVCSFIRARLRKRALIILLTSIDDPVSAESLSAGLDLVARKHLVMIAMFRPEEAAPVFESELPSSVDDLYAKLGGHLQWSRLATLEKELRARGVRFTQVERGTLSAHLVGQYLSIKRKQLL